MLRRFCSPVGSYTALRMPTTTRSEVKKWRSEAILLINLLVFSGYFRIFLDTQERFTVYKFTWWNEICSIKIRTINITRILFAVDLDQRKFSTYHLVTKSMYLMKSV